MGRKRCVTWIVGVSVCVVWSMPAMLAAEERPAAGTDGERLAWEEPVQRPTEEEWKAWDQPPVFVGLCCGQCGGNMPLNVPGSGIPETHEWRVKVSHRAMHMPGLRDGTSEVSTSEALAENMMVPTSMDMTMTNVSVAYSLTEQVMFMGMFMYVDKEMDMVNAMGQKSEMRAEGPGDTMLMGKYRIYADDPYIPTRQASVLVGASLPTGSIDERDNGMRLPYGMQLGSGTVDPLVGLFYGENRTP